MKSSITEIFVNAVRKSFPEEHALPPIFLETPKQKEHGDYALNIAMVLASNLKKNPREIARTIIEHIEDDENVVKKVEIAGPGFINIVLSEDYWRNILADIHAKKDAYGGGNTGKGLNVNIEFVSANPTGPLHVGHGRGAAVGDALARILSAAGYNVTREYYWNDAGAQIGNLGVSENYWIRAKDDPDFSRKIPFPEYGYQGDYVKEVTEELTAGPSPAISTIDRDAIRALSPEEVVDPGSAAASLTGSEGAKILKKKILQTLENFGNITFDVQQSEWELHESSKVAEAIGYLEQKGLLKEEDGAKWFRSSEYGDEKDRVLVKEDGALTYLAADIAYHRKKMERGYDRIIDVWGADHHGYIPRVKGAIEAMGFDPDNFSVLLVQMVTLMREGKPVPMSKRSGEFVTLQDVIDEVGSDAARFFFLMRRCDSHLDFDLELAKKTTADNPVFYVQYMHARICSILKHAKESGIEIPSAKDVNLGLLSQEEEIEIIKYLASFPEVVEGCAESMEPHRLTIFLINLAIAFHSYYNKSRIVTEDANLSRARLYMAQAAKIVVKNALTLLGVRAPESM